MGSYYQDYEENVETTNDQYYESKIPNFIFEDETKSPQEVSRNEDRTFLDDDFNIPVLISQENIKLGQEIGYQKCRTFIADYGVEKSHKKVVAKEINDMAQYNKLLKITDENIVGHIGIVEPNTKNNLPLLLMDYVEGKTLKKKLQESNKLELDKILDWALQIAKGVSALHDRDIIHRDLSSNNIMITNDSKLKLIDIGDQLTHGTPLNMAPEAFASIGSEINKMTKMSDVFSFGSILWEIVTCLKEKPFEDIELNELNEFFIAYKICIKKQNLKIPNDCDQDLAQLMQDCWKFEPTERPTFKKICKRLEKKQTR